MISREDIGKLVEELRESENERGWAGCHQDGWRPEEEENRQRVVSVLAHSLDDLFSRMRVLEDYVRAKLSVEHLICSFCNDLDHYNENVRKLQAAHQALPRDLYSRLEDENVPVESEKLV